MSNSVTYALLVFFIGTFLVGIAVLRAINRMRRDNHDEIENRYNLAMERLMEERHQNAVRAALMSGWMQRVTTGALLHLTDDNRATAVVGRKIRSVDSGVCWVYPLRQEVYKWCRSSLSGEFEMVPFFNDDERVAILWFANPHDALAFKMRWY